MNPSSDAPGPGLLRALGRRLAEAFPRKRRGGAGPAAFGAALAAGAALLLVWGPGALVSHDALPSIEAGRVADRDVAADREVSYVDEKATALRIEAEQRLVLPVFYVDEKPADRALERFRTFQDLVESLAARRIAGDTLFLTVQSEFPGMLQKEEVLALVRSPLRRQALTHADSILRRLLEQGIVSPPAAGLERYNPDYVEIRRLRDGKPEAEELPASRLVTLKNLPAAINEEIAARRLARPVAAIAAGLVRDFAVEDAFFDAEQSNRRLESVRSKTEPVVRTISKGERLVRKGAMVSEADAARLAAAHGVLARIDWGAAAGSLGLLAIAAFMGLYLLGGELAEARIDRKGRLIAAAAAPLYFAVALLVGRFSDLGPLEVGFLLPTALMALVAAVMVGPRFSILLGLVLALLGQAAVGLDGGLFAFCVVSAAAAAFSVKAAKARVDLVRDGLAIAALEAVAAAVVSASGSRLAPAVLLDGLYGAANGFASALLALALLPLLEQALNASSRFRLMDLSDLNAPILKRLLTVAPGTYSHSVTVAHLAESACREIGADPLLARVGAYYHDIGKIEQPEYFIENQAAGYNKHDEINPRLSATVIRSHVKLGAEKARALGLPEDVVEIVARHHGNSVITWFYDQARKSDPDADPDDFTYPGQPPSAREAAVVMLADAVEAASRSLKKPTMARLEDFIRDVIMDKVRHGQLDSCDLTFKDLESIRTSFTRILAGHFHSRLEYPRLKEQPR